MYSLIPNMIRAARGLRLIDDSIRQPEQAGEDIEALHPAELDSERQKLARQYARQRQVLSLVNLGLSALVIGVFLFSGASFWLRDALVGLGAWEPLPGWRPLLIGVYFLVLFAAAFVLGLPLSYYSGYVLSHRYGISTQKLGAWVVDLFKGTALSVVFELVAVEFVYMLLAVTPTTWWLWTGVAMLFFTVILANLAPIIFLPIFYKLTPLDEGDVKQRALKLAAQARTRVGGIYAMNMSSKTTAANAMVIGLGNTRRIVIGDTLLDRYTPDEIETVVAHELGHQVHRDSPKLIAVESVTTLVGLYLVNLVLQSVVARAPQYHGLADAATMPLLGAALAVFALITLPLTNGFSRWVEHRADVYALETTRKPNAFISAMTRLANQNLAELEPARIVEFLLYNHPSIGRRLATAQRFIAEEGQPG